MTRPGATGDDDRVADAVRARAGGLVAVPTETVYGLGADAANPDAVQAAYAVKGRPPDHPLIVHVASAESLLAGPPRCQPPPSRWRPPAGRGP